ncbi:hypothetical protein V6000_004593 [Aspergillus fumigatus]|nr:hypothetical protein KXX49_000917 [Aspergillus fumigatus]
MKELVLRHYLNPKYSDLTIICNGEVFPAHRNIVCPQSMYFENACDGRFKESNGEVILEDRDPILVRKMLEFLYTGDYTFEAPNAKGSFESENTSGEVSHTDLDQDLQVSQGETSSAHPRTDQAFFHAQMYAQGAYFQIEGLKMKAKEYFRESFMRFTDRESYTSAVLEVYGSTEDHDRGLRDLVVQMTTDNLLLLRANNNPILDGTFLEAVPNFMLEICLSALDRCAKHQREYRGWSYYN